jgi:hypothetical protein
MCNGTRVVQLPAGLCNNSGTLIDNVFLDNNKHKCISVYPKENGLDDHDAQILVLQAANSIPRSY